MDIKELRNQTIKQLEDLLAKAGTSVRDLRFSVGAHQQTHVRLLRVAKRSYARIKTVIREKGHESTT